MEADGTTTKRDLEALLRTRFHGAANIRGIRYQILYSVFRAVERYAQDHEASLVRLEGIEDVDLLGLRLGDEYIQVKLSQESWNWSKLKDPLASFLEVYRADPNSRFVLAVNFPLRRDIERLNRLESLPNKERVRVERKYRNLWHRVGASLDEAEELVQKLTIVSMPEDQIWKQLRSTLVEVFGLGSEIVDIYILVLVARFLDWARDRTTVNGDDLARVRSAVGEALAREAEFQAYGRGLIDRISWQPDASPEDFFEGKGTRPGHVAAGVDVRRPLWLGRIGEALKSSKICILRSSSGQGKSALMYRYAYENWLAENTFILRFAESWEHVELIRNYLRFRADLGLPILLLVDNAGWKTRLWPAIAQECAAIGTVVLVTVRNEDWHRFARLSLTNYEILEPTVALDEATQIYEVFWSNGRLHSSIDSPEWAYERVGEPRLLMEYVYFLTHGRMLEDRLRDQVKQFAEHEEDPGKTEILRRIALADVLGSPVLAGRLLQDIDLRGDPQQVLQSLSNEYINVESGIITGLHWVRSDHLSRILHEGYLDPGITALATLPSVPLERVSSFISNAVCSGNIDTALFIQGLIAQTESADLEIVLAFLEGIFEAGEREFFEANQPLFDEAYQLSGSSGAMLLGSEFLPILKVDTIDRMVDLLEEDKNQNFRKLQEIASRVSVAARGLDLCCAFLDDVNKQIEPEVLQAEPGKTGRLLDWCYLCGAQLSAWPLVRDSLISSPGSFELPADAFCWFAQGLYRYDQPTYHNWFLQHRENVIGYLKLHTDCVQMQVSDAVLYIEFLPDLEDIASSHDQCMSRLRTLRSAIPFCQRYQSQGVWISPFGLKPSIDDTRKDIPQENLPLESDVQKNAVWMRIVEAHYLPDSFYRYERAWYNLRKHALQLAQGLSDGLQLTLVGKPFNFHESFDEGELLLRLADSLRIRPDPPSQTAEGLRDALKEGPARWAMSFQNFLFQNIEYIQDTKKQRIGRLSVYNFADAVKHLPMLHSAFSQLFEVAPDYFDARSLAAPEIEVYGILVDLLNTWILDPPKTRQRDILQYVRAKRERKRKEAIRRVEDQVRYLEEAGMTIILPQDVYVDHPLRYFPIAFSVDDPRFPEKPLEAVFEQLVKVTDVSDFFCLVPIYKGKRFIEGGYQISSSQITQLEAGQLRNWEAFIPHELPTGVLESLPPLPFRTLPKMQVWANMLGLFGALSAFIEQARQISVLGESKNEFEMELYHRYRRRLESVEDLHDAVSQARGSLEVEFHDLETSPAFQVLRDFFLALEKASQQGTLFTALSLDEFEPEELLDALDQLFQTGF